MDDVAEKYVDDDSGKDLQSLVGNLQVYDILMGKV